MVVRVMLHGKHDYGKGFGGVITQYAKRHSKYKRQENELGSCLAYTHKICVRSKEFRRRQLKSVYLW